MRISIKVLSQLFRKYACMLDILIHQFVHIEFSQSKLIDKIVFLSFGKSASAFKKCVVKLMNHNV